MHVICREKCRLLVKNERFKRRDEKKNIPRQRTQHNSIIHIIIYYCMNIKYYINIIPILIIYSYGRCGEIM